MVSQQVGVSGLKLPVALGWHVHDDRKSSFLFKEGGGAGFHCEMRLYRSAGIGTVVMTNATNFDVSRFLSKMDKIAAPDGFERARP